MKAKLLAAAFVAIVAQTVIAGERVSGIVTHVRDVDTIEVDGLPIRLDGVDGPELKEKGGRDAKQWMVRTIQRKPVTCHLTGKKTYDRWVATCFNRAGQDIGALAIVAGHARDCPRYSNGATDSSRRQIASRCHSTLTAADTVRLPIAPQPREATSRAKPTRMLNADRIMRSNTTWLRKSALKLRAGAVILDMGIVNGGHDNLDLCSVSFRSRAVHLSLT